MASSLGAESLPLVAPTRRRGGLRGVAVAAVRRPFASLAVLMIVVLVVSALFGPWIAPDALHEAHRGEQLTPPGRDYLMGTDHLGRDILTRIIYGSQVTLLVGGGTAVLTGVVALAVGGVSAYLRGQPDMVVQRAVDVWMSFPAILLILTLVTVLAPTGQGYGFFGLGRGPDWGPDPNTGPWIWQTAPRTTIVVLVLGVVNAGGLSRVVRSAVIDVTGSPHVAAARSIGAGHVRIFLRHVLPNVMPVVIVLAAAQLAAAVLAEATLGYLGVGVTNFPTWGQMLAGQARVVAAGSPYVVVFPGLAIGITVLGFTMLGDVAHDTLDPRRRRR